MAHFLPGSFFTFILCSSTSAFFLLGSCLIWLIFYLSLFGIGNLSACLLWNDDFYYPIHQVITSIYKPLSSFHFMPFHQYAVTYIGRQSHRPALYPIESPIANCPIAYCLSCVNISSNNSNQQRKWREQNWNLQWYAVHDSNAKWIQYPVIISCSNNHNHIC